jgi:hypothetical protein
LFRTATGQRQKTNCDRRGGSDRLAVFHELPQIDVDVAGAYGADFTDGFSNASLIEKF